MYSGYYTATFDDKGRVIVPYRLRDNALKESGAILVSDRKHGTLISKPRFQMMLDRIENEAERRLVLAFANEVELDTVNRILVPRHIRQRLNLDDMHEYVLFVGAGDVIELWNCAEFEKAHDLPYRHLTKTRARHKSKRQYLAPAL